MDLRAAFGEPVPGTRTEGLRVGRGRIAFAVI